jgi:hypothetical protein
MNARNTWNICFAVLSIWLLNRTSPVSGQTYDFTTLAGSASQGSNDGPVANARFFAP